jgi:hypothetical protein
MVRRLMLAAAVWAIAGCSATELAPATADNVVDTVTMGSLAGAALRYPSAFDVTIGEPVRTDQTSSFDFVYTRDSLGRHLLMPLHAFTGLGVVTGSNPGFIRQTGSFESLIEAPTDTYLTTDTLVIAPGDVLAVRSRVACYLGVPQYGKLHVLDFNDSLLTVRLEILSDTNCGYKNLQVGLPTD